MTRMRSTRALALLFPVAVLIGALIASHLRADPPSTAASAERPITPEERDHWAYRPLRTPEVPQVADPRFAAHPVDAFIKAALDARSIATVPRAGKATLLRRLSFDLTGLPPSTAEVQSFLADDSPDAYQRQVDRLLASPAYGQRFAQHWLDLARFAETDGFEHDLVRANAWRYRDWVIDALNRDLPYDEFVRLQLAGDELRPGDPQAAIATGFLLCGPDMPDLNLQEERRHVVLNEMTSTVSAVLMAMQFGCAQCHDHKYDPIRIHDFYRLRGFFESSNLFRDHPIPTPEQRAARQEAEQANPEFRAAMERRQALEELGRQRFHEKNPDVVPKLKYVLGELSKAERKEYDGLAKTLQNTASLPELPMGRVMQPSAVLVSHVYLRGDFRTPGETVGCGFPAVLSEKPAASADCDAAGSDSQSQAAGEKPRTRLARWLTSPDHPLTARVIANRLWQWHFGVGLSPSSSDFGLMGREPTHPDLLDWLAGRIVAEGWSLKKMHRLLVTSETYQLASSPFDREWSPAQTAEAEQVWTRAQATDPDNLLSWHHRRQRLEGETIRDAMLTATDRMSSRRGGPGIRPPLSPEVTETLLKDQWQVNGDSEDHRRASIYLFVRRNLRYPMFDVFDRPDTNASCTVRHQSTTATQSLVMFNSSFSLKSARHLAGAIVRSGAATPAEQVAAAYLQVFNRPANAEELQTSQTFLIHQADALRAEGRDAKDLPLPAETPVPSDPYTAAALVDFCLALFNANEFVYLD